MALARAVRNFTSSSILAAPSAAAACTRAAPNVFFDIHIASQPAGRIIFKLYDSTTPHTAANSRPASTAWAKREAPSTALSPDS
ncbi:hypothetical protein K438DRAFT_1994654 [Mycena galopus ATCC 62051]|nr:hypothetical protein K438DRAFT_1994654 [Mycena galopus ATCC 62051]